MNMINMSNKYIRVSLFFFVLITVTFCRASSESEKEFNKARAEMVKTQIAARGISDKRVLEAMTKVERHKFVPEEYRIYAYVDHALPIDEDQTISQPYIVALMTELLELKGSEKVLEIGTGSGYQAAVLAELASEVYTIEIVEPLAKSSDSLLSELGYKNIFVRAGDGYKGWPEKAPFDAIIVTCAPETIPQPLIDQLADGGRLVIPVGDKWQELILLTKKDGKITQEKIIPVRFVPMTGEAEKKNK